MTKTQILIFFGALFLFMIIDAIFTLPSMFKYFFYGICCLAGIFVFIWNGGLETIKTDPKDKKENDN